jgi:hypothetical protein
LQTIQVDRSASNKDIGLLEATSQGTKNTKTLSLKLELMPVVGPIAGVGIASFGNWYDHYSEARREAGLIDLEELGKENIVLLPKRTTAGNFAENVPAIPGDLSIALRAILSRYGWQHADTAKISSHSCRATLLSMAAKRGTLDEGERKILGYHLERGSATVKSYSRDVMSAPLRKLNSIIREVAVGFFLPSTTRAGRFPTDEDEPQVFIADRFSAHLMTVFPDRPDLRLPPPAADDAETEDDFGDQLDIASLANSDDEFGQIADHLSTAETCGDELGHAAGSQLNMQALPQSEADSPGTEDDSSSFSTSSDSDSAVYEVLADTCGVETHPSVTDLWKIKGGSYHIGSTKSDLHFKCGVKIGHSATRIVKSPRFMSPRCKRCFAN